MTTLSSKELDALLTLQLSVAWAGEARCEPPRQGWWSTSMVDEYGGLDLFARLLPKTGKWAALEVVRHVARQADDATRKKAANPDEVRTIFHLGFALDEQLDDRLAHHKRAGHDVQQALPEIINVEQEWVPEMWTAWLEGLAIPRTTCEVTPGGRLVRFKNDATGSELTELERMRHLVGALYKSSDLSTAYPAPHMYVK